LRPTAYGFWSEFASTPELLSFSKIAGELNAEEHFGVSMISIAFASTYKGAKMLLHWSESELEPQFDHFECPLKPIYLNAD
jgi:hypothetical protein